MDRRGGAREAVVGPQPPSSVSSPRGSSLRAGRVLGSRVRSSLTCRGTPTCCTLVPPLPPQPPAAHCCHQHLLRMGYTVTATAGAQEAPHIGAELAFFQAPSPKPVPSDSHRQPCKQLPARADPGFPSSLGGHQGQIQVPWHRSGKSLAGVSPPPSCLSQRSSVTCLSHAYGQFLPSRPQIPLGRPALEPQLPDLTSSPAYPAWSFCFFVSLRPDTCLSQEAVCER